MIWLIFALSELLLLFFSSQILTKALSRLFFSLTKSEKLTIYFLALVFFPGVVIHELAHALMAAVLFVQVGHMEFMPKITEHGVKLGSVQIGRCDPIRRLLIGVAPVLAGTSLLVGIVFLFYTNTLGPFHQLPHVLQYLFILLLLFIIGNTMFSSRKDMEGSIEFFLIVVLLIFLLYLFGVRFPVASILAFLEQEEIVSILQRVCVLLLLPLGVNLLIISLIKILKRR